MPCTRDEYCTMVFYSREFTLISSALITIPCGAIGLLSTSPLIVHGTFAFECLHVISWMMTVVGVSLKNKYPYFFYNLFLFTVCLWNFISLISLMFENHQDITMGRRESTSGLYIMLLSIIYMLGAFVAINSFVISVLLYWGIEDPQ